MTETIRRATRKLLLASLVAGAGLAAVGCHRATEQDCEKILDRMVELELKDQGINEPGTIAARKAEAKARKHDDLIKQCVGKRLPESSLKCIDNAQTPDEITEKCLR